MLLRNWKAIADVSCPDTKYALSACKKPEVLERLAHAFPECFRHGKHGEVDLFSWKRILKIAERCHSQEFREEHPPYPFLPYLWLKCLKGGQSLREDELDLKGIPILAQWGSMWFGNGETVPDDVMAQLSSMRTEGYVMEGPLFLNYQNTRCVVGAIWLETVGAISLGEVFAEHALPDLESEICELALVPADVIDFDC